VITGAASGIGRAAATRFAEAGAHLVLADLTDATDLARELRGSFVRTDVSDETAIEALMRHAAGFGPIDIVVNSAGIMGEAPIAELEITAFSRMITVNTHSVLLTMKHAVPHMTDGGSIVNISSTAALGGAPGYGAYSASKAAVLALTRVAAVEYGPSGIRVNAICPSSVDTPMLRAQDNGDQEAALTSTASPLGRISKPEDIAALLHFLAADDCPLISGQAITIDGGSSAGVSIAVLESLVAASRLASDGL
jgi:3alpha(or 20beta)-hydroxysteroid dehydrogenase